jgi:hypothetical protein
MTINYYLAFNNFDTDCQGGSPTDGYFDLEKSSSVTEQAVLSDVADVTVFEDRQIYDIVVTGDNPSTGTITLNVVIQNLRNADVRARVEEIAAPSGCAINNNSAWSATYSASGTMTDGLSLTWGSGTRLRLVIQGKEKDASMGQRAFEIAVESSGASYVQAPWEPAAGFGLALLGVGR